ncbi:MULTISPECIES: DUF732 domain-containing protein [Mycolicibacter]|uniref:DUF732 domain-containing protein n=1 Tax=Mycolicibacter sinensis (strain JDM601) TaxID=875328 RepID=A0A1A2NHQ2_MYCSD|nr:MULTISPECIES: DUF732 domain-containing protein [Mycolicibacter]OBH14619.1 hypothetical protein A5694_11990 [Mycolicibacter sinensis]OBI32075.1 hypothetical protein A5710_16510 [Mycolicibacter sinensis]
MLVLTVNKIFVAAGLAFAIAAAGPAHAGPDGANSDQAFIASLRQSGITFASEGQAIAAARAVCGLINNGESGLQVVSELQSDNTALTLDGAAQFAAIAANAYCPAQLQSAKS